MLLVREYVFIMILLQTLYVREDIASGTWVVETHVPIRRAITEYTLICIGDHNQIRARGVSAMLRHQGHKVNGIDPSICFWDTLLPGKYRIYLIETSLGVN